MMDNSFIKQIFIGLSLSVLVACAGSSEDTIEDGVAEEKQRPDCIIRSSIRGYTVLDESNLIIEGSRRRNYHVSLYRRARGLMNSHGISFESPTNRICAAFGEITYGGGFLHRGVDSGKARIEFIRELNTDEHEDLLIKYGQMEPEILQTPTPREVEGAEVEELDPAAKSN